MKIITINTSFFARHVIFMGRPYSIGLVFVLTEPQLIKVLYPRVCQRALEDTIREHELSSLKIRFHINFFLLSGHQQTAVLILAQHLLTSC